MINTQLKFKAEVPNSLKVVVQGQFDLEGQGHQFSNPFRCSINSSNWKVNSK